MPPNAPISSPACRANSTSGFTPTATITTSAVNRSPLAAITVTVSAAPDSKAATPLPSRKSTFCRRSSSWTGATISGSSGDIT